MKIISSPPPHWHMQTSLSHQSRNPDEYDFRAQVQSLLLGLKQMNQINAKRTIEYSFKKKLVRYFAYQAAVNFMYKSDKGQL